MPKFILPTSYYIYAATFVALFRVLKMGLYTVKQRWVEHSVCTQVEVKLFRTSDKGSHQKVAGLKYSSTQ